MSERLPSTGPARQGPNDEPQFREGLSWSRYLEFLRDVHRATTQDDGLLAVIGLLGLAAAQLAQSGVLVVDRAEEPARVMVEFRTATLEPAGTLGPFFYPGSVLSAAAAGGYLSEAETGQLVPTLSGFTLLREAYANSGEIMPASLWSWQEVLDRMPEAWPSSPFSERDRLQGFFLADVARRTWNGTTSVHERSGTGRLLTHMGAWVVGCPFPEYPEALVRESISVGFVHRHGDLITLSAAGRARLDTLREWPS